MSTPAFFFICRKKELSVKSIFSSYSLSSTSNPSKSLPLSSKNELESMPFLWFYRSYCLGMSEAKQTEITFVNIIPPSGIPWLRLPPVRFVTSPRWSIAETFTVAHNMDNIFYHFLTIDNIPLKNLLLLR
jgi:hypothetical protein